jgi:hypothetical protein
MIFGVEWWTFPCDEEGGEHEMEGNQDFTDMKEAMEFSWERMEEGFATRMWRR